MVHHPAFATDDDLSSPPTNVVKFERDDLTRAQTKSSKQKQDRVVPAPTGASIDPLPPVRVYFVGREKRGRHGLAIFADLGTAEERSTASLAA